MTTSPQEQQRPAAPPDLEDCAQEPIHGPGAIQPHGLLLALRPADGTTPMTNK